MDAFLTILNNANEIMKQYHPNALFLQFTRDFKLVGSPYIFTFRTPEGTAVLKYIDGTGFVTPPENHPPLLGVRTVPLLISLGDAQKQVPFTPENVALYWVLYPGIEQPYFAFQAADKIAFVGAYDGKLNPSLTKIDLTLTPAATPTTNVPVSVR